MTKNMGGIDKIIRLVVGIVILLIGLVFKSWWGLVGLVPIVTSFCSFCPFYVPLKINTTKKD